MSNALRTLLLLLACTFASQATTLYIYFGAPTYSPTLTAGGPILGAGTNLTTPSSATATFYFAYAMDEFMNPVDLNDYTITDVQQMVFSVGYSDDQNPVDAAQEGWAGQVETTSALVLQNSGVGGSSAQALGAGLSTQSVDFNPNSAVDNYLISTNFAAFVYRFSATSGDIRFRGISGDVVAVAEATPLNQVPEPATSALAGGALLLVGLIGRRFRR